MTFCPAGRPPNRKLLCNRYKRSRSSFFWSDWKEIRQFEKVGTTLAPPALARWWKSERKTHYERISVSALIGWKSSLFSILLPGWFRVGGGGKFRPFEWNKGRKKTLKQGRKRNQSESERSGTKTDNEAPRRPTFNRRDDPFPLEWFPVVGGHSEWKKPQVGKGCICNWKWELRCRNVVLL